MCMYICVYVCTYIQGCCLKYTVKGLRFEETNTHISFNHIFLEESQNGSWEG